MKNRISIQNITDEQLEILYQGIETNLEASDKNDFLDQFITNLIRTEYLERKLKRLAFPESGEVPSDMEKQADSTTSSYLAILEILKKLQLILQRLLEPPAPLRA